MIGSFIEAVWWPWPEVLLEGWWEFELSFIFMAVMTTVRINLPYLESMSPWETRTLRISFWLRGRGLGATVD